MFFLYKGTFSVNYLIFIRFFSSFFGFFAVLHLLIVHLSDLLKLIKSDLRKLRQDKQLLEGSREETTYLSPPVTLGKHGHPREKTKRPEASTPLSPGRPVSSTRLSSKVSKHLNADRYVGIGENVHV